MKYLVGLVTVEVEVVVGTTWCPLTVTAQPLDLHIFPWLPGAWSLDPAWTRPPPDLFSPLVTSTTLPPHTLDTHTYYTWTLDLARAPIRLQEFT